MPEGPEVRRYAVALDAALANEPVVEIAARTRVARAWLSEHAAELVGRRVLRVRSHGKHIVGWIEDDVWFHSHLMMWGRWLVEPTGAVEPDRRERARIVTPSATAILRSAPIFEIGTGDPYRAVERLAALGPDVLPYPHDGPFDARTFLRRLTAPGSRDREVGVALLDQTIAAGIGNYLRAEILFACRLDPWQRVSALSRAERACLAEHVASVAQRAYDANGATASDEARTRMRSDDTLVYQPGREGGVRHHVFRRTNLPCLECGDVVRQRRQVTHADEEGERSRITYFCPTCQGVPMGPRSRRVSRPAATAKG